MSDHFTEGTRVTVIRDGDSHFGEIGEVVYVDHGNGKLHDVMFDGDDVATYGYQDLDEWEAA